MKRLLPLLVAAVLTLILAACGSSRHAVNKCQVKRTCPSSNGRYAWRPLPGAAPLVCGSPGRVNQGVFSQFLGYRRRIYMCKLPAPADPNVHGGVSFTGPTTVAAGTVPLKQNELQFTFYVYTSAPAAVRLTVEWGDGTRLQRTMNGSQTVTLTHGYSGTRKSYLLASLKGPGGYVGITGGGPYERPAPGPRARFCAKVETGKGGTLSATTNLPCAEAMRLFTSMSPRRKVEGYTCTTAPLPPDANVITCRSGSREFVFTTNQ